MQPDELEFDYPVNLELKYRFSTMELSFIPGLPINQIISAELHLEFPAPVSHLMGPLITLKGLIA